MADSERDIADIKQTLGRLEPMLIKLMDGQSDLKAEVAELRGRLAEQSSMLQLAIAARMGRKPAA